MCGKWWVRLVLGCSAGRSLHSQTRLAVNTQTYLATEHCSERQIRVPIYWRLICRTKYGYLLQVREQVLEVRNSLPVPTFLFHAQVRTLQKNLCIRVAYSLQNGPLTSIDSNLDITSGDRGWEWEGAMGPFSYGWLWAYSSLLEILEICHWHTYLKKSGNNGIYNDIYIYIKPLLNISTWKKTGNKDASFSQRKITFSSHFTLPLVASGEEK